MVIPLKDRKVPIAGTEPYTDAVLYARHLKAGRLRSLRRGLARAQTGSEQEKEDTGSLAMAEVIAEGVVLADGTRAFDVEPEALFELLDEDFFLLLWEAAGGLNGMTKQAEAALEKNSPTRPSGASPSGSPSPSAGPTLTPSSTS